MPFFYNFFSLVFAYFASSFAGRSTAAGIRRKKYVFNFSFSLALERYSTQLVDRRYIYLANRSVRAW